MFYGGFNMTDAAAAAAGGSFPLTGDMMHAQGGERMLLTKETYVSFSFISRERRSLHNAHLHKCAILWPAGNCYMPTINETFNYPTVLHIAPATTSSVIVQRHQS